MKLHKQIHFKQYTSKVGILTIIPWKTTESMKIVQFICIMIYLYQDVNDFSSLDMLYISLQSIIQEPCHRAIPVSTDSRGPRPDRKRCKCRLWNFLE